MPSISEFIEEYRQQLNEIEELSSHIRELQQEANFYWNGKLDYSTILNKIRENDKFLSAKILEVLQLRDSIQTQLSDRYESSKELVELVELDDRLKQQAELEEWANRIESLRKSFNPKAESEYWWWFQKSRLKKRDWLIKIGTNALWIIALALLINFSSKIIAGNPDVIGTSAVLLNTLLTLLIGRGILWGASGWIENGMDHLGFPQKYEKFVQLFLSVVVLLFAWTLHQDLPNISEIYYNRAEAFYQEPALRQLETNYHSSRTPLYEFWMKWSGREVNDQKSQFALALADYTRATKFDPENWRAYNRLGEIYEDLQDTEQAVTQYRVAAKGELIEGLINLSRYYILKYDPEIKKEEAQQSNLTAIGFLTRADTALDQQSQRSGRTGSLRNQYDSYTHSGWAYLNLAHTGDQESGKISFERATTYLQDAVNLEILEVGKQAAIQNRKIAHCVRAEALEASHRLGIVLSEKDEQVKDIDWRQCSKTLADSKAFWRPYEAAWHTKASEY